jgi:hypothetical protein
MMVDRSQIPYLVRLLEDDSPAVRAEVLHALESFGPLLESELHQSGITLTRSQAHPIQHVLDRSRRELLRASWKEWFSVRGDKKRLETALGMIIDFQDGKGSSLQLAPLLDSLALEYRNGNAALNPIGLARFLFRERGLGGVEQADYYNPLNSNLVYVITERRGIPIALACIYILVGYRLGLAIEGCNFPGHFLAIAPAERSRVLVDCYNGGRTIGEEDLANIDARVSLKDILRLECRGAAIIARVLRNLKTAYEHAGNADNASLMDDLLRMMNADGSLSTLQ